MNKPLIYKLLAIFILVIAWIMMHEYAHAMIYSYDNLTTHYGANLKGVYTTIDVGQHNPSAMTIEVNWLLDSFSYTMFPIYLLLIGILIKK